MKTIITIILVAVSCASFVTAQEKFLDKNGVITFEASEAVFEPVKATNSNVTMLLDATTGELAALALMKGFRFKNSLMEEHFNENYIESETYPKATFKGTLENFDSTLLNQKSIQVPVEGVLTLHGKKKKIVTLLNLQKVEDIITVSGSFSVTPQDFDIEIPKVVQNKIAKEIQISLDFKLVKK